MYTHNDDYTVLSDYVPSSRAGNKLCIDLVLVSKKNKMGIFRWDIRASATNKELMKKSWDTNCLH